MPAPRGPGQRAGLSRDLVLDAATDLIVERGAVTMRAVAQRLGVAPNALYSHVADKTELVDGVLDRVLAQVETPPAGLAPLDALHRLMSSTHDVLLRHPQLVPAFLTRQGARGPNAQRLGVVALEHLTACGLGGDAARDGLRVLIVYTIGFAAFDPGADERPLHGSELRHSFESGLRWLLSGMTATSPG